MLIIHMKSGKEHIVNMELSDFEEINKDKSVDAILAGDFLDDNSIHILPKDNIESIQAVYKGDKKELKINKI